LCDIFYNKRRGDSSKISVSVEVWIFSLSLPTGDIFSPGDLFDKLDTPPEFLLLHSWDMEGFAKDAEDIITLKIPYHLVTLPRPDMTTFHH
jgi:hypothetical protein